MSSLGEVLVASDVPYSGTRSAKTIVNDIAKCAERTGAQIHTGSMTFWVRPLGGTHGTHIELGKLKSSSEAFYSRGVFIVHSNNTIMWYPWEGNPIVLCDTGGNYTQITFSWNAETNKVKYECLGQSSDWVDVSLYSDIDFDYFDSVRIVSKNTLSYVDDISGVCDFDTCYLCENFADCSNAGCFWFYNLGTYSYFCSDVSEEME
ncbi:unnamed protein product, partial [marine sediment metagenome]